VLLIGIANTFISLPKAVARRSLSTVSSLAKHATPTITKQWLARKTERITPRKATSRQYLRHDINVEGFFKCLNKKNIRYVILRWFEHLPNSEKGEDIDILVEDDDLPAIKEFFSSFNNGKQAFDIYSTSGANGYNFRSIPYLPPNLAKDILRSRVLHNEIYAAPDTRHHFLSMAYHVVFHKAELSGLAYGEDHTVDRNNESTKIDHDYNAILLELAHKANIELTDVNFLALYKILKTNGWLPQLDTMRIMARHSTWVQRQLPPTPQLLQTKNSGQIIAFIVRDWAIRHDKMNVITSLLRQAFLDVILVHEFNDEEKENATCYIRGGKWDRGPYPVSGGAPAAIIVAYDYNPVCPDEKTLKIYPFLENKHILIKHTVRDYFNAENLLTRHTNCLHSSDSEEEAWDYIQHTIPHLRPSLEAERTKRIRAFETNYPILETYKANGTRAKTQKIDFNGQPAVQKTFRLGCERFAEREAFAYEYFSKRSPLILPLLEKSEHNIIIPWVENKLSGLTQKELKHVLKPHALSVLKAMKMFYEHGYAIVGFYPGNLLLDENEQLYIVDFEFLFKYKSQPSTFWDSYDMAGIPKGFDGDLPRDHRRKGHTYTNTWQPLLGPISQYKGML